MLHLIINPNSRKTQKHLKAIEKKLRDEGAEYEICAGGSKEETRRIAGELSRSPSTIVTVGGDGTLNDVLSGIAVMENVTLGLVPLGTGNDFAKAANIPAGVKALDLILHSEPKPTDYLQCGEGMRSMNIAGLGIDVDILERCYHMHGSAKGKYFRSLLVSLRKYAGQKVRVTADGNTFEEVAFIAAVCNGRYFGGGIPICMPAEMGDGKLDLVVIGCPKRSKIPLLLMKLMRGKILTEPIARHILCDAVCIEQEGEYIQLDGELVRSKVLDACIVHGKLNMYRG